MDVRHPLRPHPARLVLARQPRPAREQPQPARPRLGRLRRRRVHAGPGLTPARHAVAARLPGGGLHLRLSICDLVSGCPAEDGKDHLHPGDRHGLNFGGPDRAAMAAGINPLRLTRRPRIFTGGVEKTKIIHRGHQLHHLRDLVDRPVEGDLVTDQRPFLHRHDRPRMLTTDHHKTHLKKEFPTHSPGLLQFSQVTMAQFERDINRQIAHDNEADVIILLT